jgi:hypothetical protein
VAQGVVSHSVVQICDLRALILAPGMAPESEGGVINWLPVVNSDPSQG